MMGLMLTPGNNSTEAVDFLQKAGELLSVINLLQPEQNEKEKYDVYTCIHFILSTGYLLIAIYNDVLRTSTSFKRQLGRVRTSLVFTSKRKANLYTLYMYTYTCYLEYT